MKRLALLAGLLLSAVPVSATDWTEVQQVESQIEQLGARIYWSKMNTGVCSERGMLGIYKIRERTVYMCQQAIRDSGEPLMETLKHEGWHAVQQLCNNGRAVLSDAKIRALLSEGDKQTLRKHYDASQHRLEAEARALEAVPTHAYLRGINHYCR